MYSYLRSLFIGALFGVSAFAFSPANAEPVNINDSTLIADRGGRHHGGGHRHHGGHHRYHGGHHGGHWNRGWSNWGVSLGVPLYYSRPYYRNYYVPRYYNSYPSSYYYNTYPYDRGGSGIYFYYGF